MHVHYRLTGSVACSLVSVVLFNLNQLTWTWSVTAEVFGLNNLFVTLLLFLLTKFEQTDCPNVKIRVSKHLFFCLSSTGNLSWVQLPCFSPWITHALLRPLGVLVMGTRSGTRSQIYSQKVARTLRVAARSAWQVHPFGHFACIWTDFSQAVTRQKQSYPYLHVVQ